MKFLKYITVLVCCLLMSGCKYYNFTGTGKIDANSFQVNYFQNVADLVEPGIERTFTIKLQEVIQSQTSLVLTNSGGDLIYEGEITNFRISPMTATADQRAAQNRLSITVKVRFINTKNEDEGFERSFSHYYDYTGSEQLVGSQLNQAVEIIYERIIQDVFNASLAKW